MRKHIKSISVFICIYILLISFSLSGSVDNSMKIQLRVDNENNSGVSINELKLFINKQEVEITGLKKNERFIGKERLLGRNFVLSFMNFENFDKVLENAVSYFVTEILEKSDTLIIHTNVDVHPVKVTGNKERMILDIKKSLERDMNYLSRKSSRIIKNINTEISKLERFFSSLGMSTGYPVGGVTFFQFFTKLIPDIQFYKNEFIVPDKKKFNKIHEQFGFREGDRYWIFLQSGNIYPFTKRIKNLVKSVRGQLSVNTSGVDRSWSKMVNNKIRELMEMMSIGSQYPVNIMKNGFINSNTSLFTIVYSIEKATNPDKALDIQLEGVLRNLSEETGGKFVETSDIEEGIKSIIDHRDQYWDVSFKIPGGMDKKKLKMILGNSNKGLIFREKIEEKELKELLKYLSKPKICIDNPGFKNNKLSFSIKSFTLNKRGGFGLLKAIIQIYDNMGKEVYRRSNTLRAANKKINISTGIPAEFSSDHTMRVSVLDMISNSLIVRDVEIEK
ncbi:MAG: hypothetical protein ABFR36_02810 [Acidobacteriota bacterium]